MQYNVQFKLRFPNDELNSAYQVDFEKYCFFIQSSQWPQTKIIIFRNSFRFF